MASKGDIQATRSTAAAGASAIVAQPIRLRGIIVASDGSGAGVLELTTTSNTGTTLLILDVPMPAYPPNLHRPEICVNPSPPCTTKGLLKSSGLRPTFFN